MVSRLSAKNYYASLFLTPYGYSVSSKKALTSVNKLCYNIEVEINSPKGNLEK